MAIIDLAAVRARIAADRCAAEDTAKRLADFLVSESIRQAKRACAVAAPIAAADEAMSRIIHRGVVRRLRADVRKAFAFAGTSDELRQWALEQAFEIYRGQTVAILEERDARLAKRGAERETPSLDAFMERAGLWVDGVIPNEVAPWVREFLKDYRTAVRGFAGVPRHVSAEAANRDAALNQEFNTLMLPYRDDPRRSYIGAVFSNFLGRSIRGAFHDHVGAADVRYGVRSNEGQGT